MSDIPSFAKLVPGFDFLQGLVKNAGSALPSMGQWVAPTLNPDELQKRIDELKTVQFWLEQNAKMLATTIQALEVQRMTLSTLKTMNVQMTDLRESMKIPSVPAAGAMRQTFGADALMDAARNAMDGIGSLAKSAGASAAPAAEPAPAPAVEANPAAELPVTAAGIVDPMQWWNALTKQFTQLATNAMKDTGADAAKGLADAMVKQGREAGETMKKAAGQASAATRAAAKKATAGKPVVKTTAKGRKPAAGAGKRSASAAGKTRAS